MLGLTVASSRLRADDATCGGQTLTLPFTDVAGSPFLCQIAAAYFSGLTNGTSSTTFSPGSDVTREQMAAFMTRTQDSALKRGSRRAALNQWWTTTPHYDLGLGTTLAGSPVAVQSDGLDLWTANNDGTASRIRASDGKLLETWTFPSVGSARDVLIAMGRVFVTGNDGSLNMIDPSQPPGTATKVVAGIGGGPYLMTSDGDRIWLVRADTVYIITPAAAAPWQVNTVSGFNSLGGILYDGRNVWVTNEQGSIGSLYKLGANANVIQTVSVGTSPSSPVFDGTNIWVPNLFNGSVTVVRQSTGVVIATLSGNGLDGPCAGAFDGERILIANRFGPSVSLWKAADLTPIGSFPMPVGTTPLDACSDGLNFWITLTGISKLGRF